MDWDTPAGWFQMGLLALALSPIAIGLGWGIAAHQVLPRLIARTDIERLANEVAARHPEDPESAAFAEEQAAWFRSQAVEQGRWRRVRRELRRRRG